MKKISQIFLVFLLSIHSSHSAENSWGNLFFGMSFSNPGGSLQDEYGEVGDQQTFDSVMDHMIEDIRKIPQKMIVEDLAVVLETPLDFSAQPSSKGSGAATRKELVQPKFTAEELESIIEKKAQEIASETVVTYDKFNEYASAHCSYKKCGDEMYEYGREKTARNNIYKMLVRHYKTMHRDDIVFDLHN